MPQTQDQPKLDPAYDYAALPDGSYAQFKKGTPPEQMKAQLTAKGLLKTSAPAAASGASGDALLSKKPVQQGTPRVPKNYGFTLQNVLANFATGVESAAKGTMEMGKTLLNPNTSGNVNRTLDQFVFKPGDEQLRKAKEDFNSHRLLEAAGHFTAAMVPILGPVAAQLGEQAGKGDIGGAASQAAGMYGFGKGVEASTGLVTSKAADFVDPAELRKRAANLDTKAFKTAEEGVRDKTAIGLQVAQEGIVTTMKQAPAKIEAIRAQKDAKVQALAQYHDQLGHTVDAVPEIQPLLQNIQQRLNTQGLITGGARTAVLNVLDQLKTERDMATGATRPIDLSRLTVSKALALTQGLGKIANWGSEAKVAVEPFIEKIRLGINNAIDKVDPEITKTRAEESRLIKARDEADSHFTKMLNDKMGLARGVMYSNAPTIGVWLGLRALGLMTPVTALGSVILLKALAESTLSRTARAALYAKAADILETTAGGGAAPPNAATTPPGPGGAGGPSLGPGGPQRPVNAPMGLPTAAPRGLPPSPPAARPPAGGSTTPTGRPLTPQELSVQSQPGTRGISTDITKWQPPPELGVSSVGDIEKRIAKGRQEAERATGGPIKRGEAGGQSVATSTTTPQPQNKAMLDRLDALLDRQPKSGAERNAIKREIGEIKKILSGEASASERSAINKRIADRERLATKRAAAGAEQTGAATSASGEAVSPGSTTRVGGREYQKSELRSVALDLGYKALAKYEGGDIMVKHLKDTAKAMQKVDPSYDEVERLTEALQILKSLPSEGGTQ
jgi:hypothetical protein